MLQVIFFVFFPLCWIAFRMKLRNGFKRENIWIYIYTVSLGGAENHSRTFISKFISIYLSSALCFKLEYGIY